MDARPRPGGGASGRWQAADFEQLQAERPGPDSWRHGPAPGAGRREYGAGIPGWRPDLRRWLRLDTAAGVPPLRHEGVTPPLKGVR